MLDVLAEAKVTLRAALGLLLLVFALTGPALAQPDPKLDGLFAALKSAPDELVAAQIVDQIWQRWTHPDDPALAGRMDEVIALQGAGHLDLVLDKLNGIIADYPSYPEGWNQRATVYFLLNNYEASLADIGKTLELEPRHFGALSGRALIYLAQDQRALALKDITKAIEIDPFLSERQLFPELSQPTTKV